MPNEFVKISELPVVSTITSTDLFIIETLTGTKAVTRATLRQETESVTAADVGLENVDNTADLDKPISTATQAALDTKLDINTAAGTYLTQTNAQSVYLSQNAASGTYLTQTNANTYYLTKTDAGNTYSLKGHEHSTGDVTTLTSYVKGSSSAALEDTDTLNQALSKLENQIDGKQASGSYAAASHNHPSSNITVLTGYTKASSVSALSAADSLNEALGKLEKALDGKQASGSYAAESHTHNTGDVALLTSYTKGSDATALATTDTLNQALSKLENQIDGKQASGSYAAASHTHVGGDVVCTGYTMAASVAAIAATDTVNQALGKLEKQLDGLETLLASI